MRIEFNQDGGLAAAIPGLQKPPLTVSTEALPPEEARTLASQVEAARVFDLPERLEAPPRGAADFQYYTLTVEDGDRRHTVSFDQFTPNPDLQALRRQLQQLQRHAVDQP